MTANGPTQDRLRELFLEKLNTEVPSVDTDLLETGVVDSLRFVELLMLLETEFGVAVSLEDLEIDRFRSIAAIADFVASRDGH